MLSPMLREYLNVASAEPEPTLDSFVSACAKRDLLRAELLRQLHNTPILLSPVSTEPAFRHGEGNYRMGRPHSYGETMRFSQWLNLAGFPGLSLPFGMSPDGLPINVQLIARPNEEELLFAIAESLEQSRGPFPRPNL